MLGVFRIRGDSMSPGLQSGDFVVALTAFCRARLGRLLVVRHPQYGIIVKRVIGIDADDACWLGSDHEAGVSSERMGRVLSDHIVGRVIWRIRARR
ncbi:MAG TPA: peptidase S24 [Gammaproteobacteria bacterium]|jgi:nickel-type superoxide dismutase maturation protease|nr:peptidase S24 [Gammaproteobacteria bacterium]